MRTAVSNYFFGDQIHLPKLMFGLRWNGKACGKALLAANRPLCLRKTEGGLEKRLEKGLANLWSRTRIIKIARIGRGQETQWETPIPIWKVPNSKTAGCLQSKIKNL